MSSLVLPNTRLLFDPTLRVLNYNRLLEYKTVREFLANIRKEFREEDEESVKVAKLKRLEQESKMMKEFVQEFRRTAKGSRYKGRLLIEEFKREMNRMIRRKLMEAEYQPSSIKQ